MGAFHQFHSSRLLHSKLNDPDIKFDFDFNCIKVYGYAFFFIFSFIAIMLPEWVFLNKSNNPVISHSLRDIIVSGRNGLLHISSLT